MAYGKIKLDTITWDNSGTDTDITVSTIPTAAQVAAKADLASPTFTGTVTAAALTVSGNLQVNGTTTTVASSTMTVTDKNIEIAKGAANDAAADGAGITIDSGDGDKTWNWVDATDSWTANQHITVQKAGNADLQLGSTDASGARIIFDGDSNGDFAGSDYASIEHNTGGDLQIKCDNPASDSQFELYVGSGSTTALVAQAAGEVQLYHNGTQKAVTTAAGFEVSGSVTDSKGNVRSIPKSAK